MARPDSSRDPSVQLLLRALRERYGQNHPKAKIEAYRQNFASIRVCIIDPQFAHQNLIERENTVWPILEELPEDVRQQLTMLLLITPQERAKDIVSLEFDDPIPSHF